ncbi:hypothetical protein PFLUV_G00111270 [Perca fluviatilis]|uniref:Uncharacterized protein n=1 Tax=Perca fluviatilis TaxID=8168 RepID=A0A6A5F9F2_PERFL|nr:hypothetical protein PFLUV_G00111270 [Perca fluviatilis]
MVPYSLLLSRCEKASSATGLRTYSLVSVFLAPPVTAVIMSQTNTSLLDEVVQWSQETCRQKLKTVLPKLTISS